MKTVLAAALCAFALPLAAQQVAASPETHITELAVRPASARPAITSHPSDALGDFDSQQALRSAKTVYLKSKSAFLLVDSLDRTLIQQKDWPRLGLNIVQDKSAADLVIELDRPIFTRVHTFVITDKKTSAVLGAGRVIAFDGTIACGGLAKDIVKILAAAKLPPPSKK